MKHPTTKWAALALLAMAFGPAATASAQDVVSGNLRGVTRWSGKVAVTGDVNLLPDARLEIAAGTEVSIAPRDGTAGGWNTELVEIHIQGQLIVEGHLGAPVRFAVGDGQPDLPAQAGFGTAWHGIVLHQRNDEAQRRNHVRGAQIVRAFAGIQIPGGAPLIEDCTLLGCGTGIEAGAAYKDDRYYGVTRGHAAPEVMRCRFTRCYTGLYAEGNCAPILDRCVFYDCTQGVGPRRKGISAFLDDPGCRIDHCGFLDVGTAVTGCSFVRDSWFENCSTVLQLSAYHDRIATQIEQVVFERNLVHGERRFVVGDTAVARDALRGELKLRGPVTELAAPWPPLPDGLQLQQDSAAIGKALYGLDVGPASGGTNDGGSRGELPVTLPGTVLRDMLALPIDPPKRWTRIDDMAPGETNGDGWWGLALQEQNGLMHLRRVFGATRTSGLLGFDCEAAAAGKVKLHWSGDVEALEVAIGGKSVASVEGRKRFGAGNAPLEFEHEAGPVRVMIRVQGWGSDPTLALSFEGGLQPKQPVAEAPKGPEPKLKASRKRREVFIEATFPVPVHWSPKAGTDLARVQVGGGNQTSVVGEWIKPLVLRLGPVDGVSGRTEVTVSFPGLCDVLGRPLACDPVVVVAR